MSSTLYKSNREVQYAGHPFGPGVCSTHMNPKASGKVGLVIPYFNFFDDEEKTLNLQRTLDSLHPELLRRTVVVEALQVRADSHAAKLHDIVDRVEVPKKFGFIDQKYALIRKGFTLLESDNHYSYYAWLEPGTIISRYSWDLECRSEMQRRDWLAMQPFSTVSRCMRDEQGEERLTEGTSDGLAWVYDAKAYQQSGGVFPRLPIGGGDDLHHYAVYGEAGRFCDRVSEVSPTFTERVKDWQSGWFLAYDERVGRLSDTYALTRERGKPAPYELLPSGFDKHLIVQGNGGLRWGPKTPKALVHRVKDFLRAK